jgi:alkanesulfonate monooxygenase SsuD/methylene tetrahydromethanopterin reductase-like flavin-dependent oxidoreductase (luciferase family)
MLSYSRSHRPGHTGARLVRRLRRHADEEQARALGGGRITTANGFLGTPEQVIEQMSRFVELGVDYFITGSGGFPELTTLELVTEQVLPALDAVARRL